MSSGLPSSLKPALSVPFRGGAPENDPANSFTDIFLPVTWRSYSGPANSNSVCAFGKKILPVALNSSLEERADRVFNVKRFFLYVTVPSIASKLITWSFNIEGMLRDARQCHYLRDLMNCCVDLHCHWRQRETCPLKQEYS